MKMFSFLKRHRLRGFTLAESVISLGIGAVAIMGGITLSQHEMRMVKSVRESNAASHSLEERVEQLRLVNWRQMTDSEHLIKHYFPQRPASGRGLPGVVEQVSVTAYPDPEACTPLVIETNEAGTPTLISSGAGFDKLRLARVNVRVAWTSSDGKNRVRELASIISNAGINATSLPAMGSDSWGDGSTGSSSTGTGTGTTDSTGGSTGTSGASGGTDGSTGTTGDSTGSTTESGDNGNGRGNAGGKPGKK